MKKCLSRILERVYHPVTVVVGGICFFSFILLLGQVVLQEQETSLRHEALLKELKSANRGQKNLSSIQLQIAKSASLSDQSQWRNQFKKVSPLFSEQMRETKELVHREEISSEIKEEFSQLEQSFQKLSKYHEKVLSLSGDEAFKVLSSKGYQEVKEDFLKHLQNLQVEVQKLISTDLVVLEVSLIVLFLAMFLFLVGGYYLWWRGYATSQQALTSLRQKQEQLEEKNQELDSYINTLDENSIIAKTDIQGRITKVNDKFCEISQYSREELIGKDHRIINSGYHSKEFFEDLWKTIKRGESWQGEIKNRAKDGSHYWVFTTIGPVKDRQGNIKEFVSYRFDITKEKEMALRLEERERQNRDMIKNIPGVVFRFVLGVDGDMYFSYLSEKAKKIFEISEKEYQSNPKILLDLVDQDHKQELYGLIFESATKLTEFEWEGQMVLGSGERRWVRTWSSPTASENEEVVWNGIVVDVTEEVKLRKELEAAQLQAIQQSKLAAVGEMAGSVAHEINNPNAVIFGYARRIEKLLSKDQLEREKLQDVAKKIFKASERITKTVTTMKRFSRDGSNDPFEVINVGDLINESLELCSQRIQDHQIKLITSRISSDIQVKGQLIPLSQVIVNLLNNADDALEEEDVKWIKVETQNFENKVQISVTDSGKGIPEETASKIMQPYFTTKEIGKGTGIGLSISQVILNKYGGQLELDQNYPNTRFVITLPKNQPSDHQGLSQVGK